ncbi:hypothetical protein V2053_003265 [Vibrio cholerae]|uniref:hypothetical protein n=1 Tax=Vibrio aestuarianus TaxID=28171 RepID=UPI0015C57EB6|nr:hypothetical protein [Vibrio aestuarianus]NGZ66641.1 hypothetical protein [Vibrio aestuarianus subsp. cardii]HAS4509404.1 hypothetical protein [Vibrio cholerae]
MLGESIYVPHSSEVVNEVMSEFRDFMHDSECTSLALQKSLELLNFFTYRSDLDDNQKDRLDALCIEAEMRIQLMSNQEQEVISERESAKKALLALKSIDNSFKYLYRQVMNVSPTYDELIEWIEKQKKIQHI